MRTANRATAKQPGVGRGFETIADTIMARWSAERDVSVSDEEVEQARVYLARRGVATSALPDGRYAIEGNTVSTLGATRLVLLGLRHLHTQRTDSVIRALEERFRKVTRRARTEGR
jgi:hypothetical protein